MISDGKDNPAYMETARIFLNDFRASSKKHRTPKIEGGTLKNGADSSRFLQKYKVLEIHLRKIKNPK